MDEAAACGVRADEAEDHERAAAAAHCPRALAAARSVRGGRRATGGPAGAGTSSQRSGNQLAVEDKMCVPTQFWRPAAGAAVGLAVWGASFPFLDRIED